MPRSNCVVLSLTSTIRTDTWDFGRQALQILYDADDRLRPERVGFDDVDMRKNFPCATVEDVRPFWAPDWEGATDIPDDVVDTLFWRRAKSPRAYGEFHQAWFNLNGSLSPSGVYMIATYRKNLDFMTPFRRWRELYRPTQAYLHLVAEEEWIDEDAHSQQTIMFSEELRGWDNFLAGIFGVRREQKPQNLGFVNYFPPAILPPAIVSQLRAAGFTVEPLGEGHLLFLCDRMEDTRKDFPTFSRRRHEAKGIIGRDVFVVEDETYF